MSRPKQSTLVIPPGSSPGGMTPFERFDNIMKRILVVPKEEVDRRIMEERRHQKKKRARPSIANKTKV